MKMYKYNLEIIKGTEDFVVKELKSKFEGIKILEKKSFLIKFESIISNIDEFRILYSALRILNESKITLNLYRREWRSEYVAAGINPALAYIMCMIAEISDTDIILDPFCGSSTIPITASIYFNAKKVIGSDISGRAIKTSITNFKLSLIDSKKYFVFRKGVRDIAMAPESIDKVISNLPFGIRAGTHKMNEETYQNFAKKMIRLLKPNGKLVLLTQEKELLKKYFDNGRFSLMQEVKIDQGGLKPNIFVFKKL